MRSDLCLRLQLFRIVCTTSCGFPPKAGVVFRFHITVVYVSGMWGAGCPVAAHFELLARDVLGVLRVRPPHIQPQQLGAAAEFWISHAGSYSDARLHGRAAWHLCVVQRRLAVLRRNDKVQKNTKKKVVVFLGWGHCQGVKKL